MSQLLEERLRAQLAVADFNGRARRGTGLAVPLSPRTAAALRREVGWGCTYPRLPRDLSPGSVKDDDELPGGTSQSKWLPKPIS